VRYGSSRARTAALSCSCSSVRSTSASVEGTPSDEPPSLSRWRARSDERACARRGASRHRQARLAARARPRVATRPRAKPPARRRRRRSDRSPARPASPRTQRVPASSSSRSCCGPAEPCLQGAVPAAGRSVPGFSQNPRRSRAARRLGARARNSRELQRGSPRIPAPASLARVSAWRPSERAQQELVAGSSPGPRVPPSPCGSPSGSRWPGSAVEGAAPGQERRQLGRRSSWLRSTSAHRSKSRAPAPPAGIGAAPAPREPNPRSSASRVVAPLRPTRSSSAPRRSTCSSSTAAAEQPVASHVELWRIDAPRARTGLLATSSRTKAQVPVEGWVFTNLPEGRYRVVCRRRCGVMRLRKSTCSRRARASASRSRFPRAPRPSRRAQPLRRAGAQPVACDRRLGSPRLAGRMARRAWTEVGGRNRRASALQWFEGGGTALDEPTSQPPRGVRPRLFREADRALTAASARVQDA
jgi:hypothetical protein